MAQSEVQFPTGRTELTSAALVNVVLAELDNNATRSLRRPSNSTADLLNED